MKNKVKCHIINNDVSIFEYYILDKVKTFQVEIIGKSGERYIVRNFSKLKDAKEYVNHISLKINV